MGSYNQTLDLFHVLLQHVEVSTALLCSVTQVCQSWRAATATQYLRSCRQLRGRLDVILDAAQHPSPEAWDDAMRSFEFWLGKHADLVRSITVKKGTGEDAETVSRYLPAQQTLAAALLKFLGNGTASGAASTSNAGAAGGSNKGPLQLEAYSSDCMGSSSILQALWSSHITSLHLSLPQHSRSDASLPSCQHLLSVFKRLPKLQSLSLTFQMHHPVSETCCKALARLTGLTHLDLGVGLNAWDMKALQLPEVLPTLPLQRLRLHCHYEHTNPIWDLSSFTQLTNLDFKFMAPKAPLEPPAALKLPAQVRVLNIVCGGADAFGDDDEFRPPGPPFINHLTALQQLQAFSTTTAHFLPDYVLRHLAALSTLQDISISYECVDAASHNQHDWVHMQHLKQLSIYLKPRYDTATPMSMTQLHQLMDAIGCASGLTSLQINMRDYPLVCIVSAADRDCRLPNNTTQAQPAAAPSAQPDGAVPAPPVAQKNEGGTASSSSGSCASSTPLCDSTDAKLPVNIFKHLTGLEHLQELQVSSASRSPPAKLDQLLSELSMAKEPALQTGSAKMLTALTALTSLQLRNLGSAVGDVAGLAVAASLRGLRQLTLCDCDISIGATKAALRRLPMLSQLVVRDGEGVEVDSEEMEEGQWAPAWRGPEGDDGAGELEEGEWRE